MVKILEDSNYKETLIGRIPKEWKVQTLETICVHNGLIRGPFGGSLKKENFIKNGYKVYEQRNAIYKNVREGNYYINNDKFNELKRFEVKFEDFIVSCSGTIGKIFQIPYHHKKGIINQALLKITVDPKKINLLYFLLYFQWNKFQMKITDNSQGGAMQNLVGMPIFKNTLIAIPPKKEQRKIAAALSDMDELIESLKEIIDKKEKIKQGTMQELLSGKRRLPGFIGEWKTIILGNVAEFFKGKGLPKSEILVGGKYKCIHYGELFRLYKANIKSIISRTNKNENVFISQYNDVLMPTSDVTPNGLAVASCIQENNVVLGGDILVIRLDTQKIHGVFLSNVVRINREQIMQLVTGTTVYHIYPSDMKKFKFKCPPTLSEQESIVEVLLNMDNEIELLEKKLFKFEKMKEGMMQELLTGRIRLV